MENYKTLLSDYLGQKYQNVKILSCQPWGASLLVSFKYKGGKMENLEVSPFDLLAFIHSKIK